MSAQAGSTNGDTSGRVVNNIINNSGTRPQQQRSGQESSPLLSHQHEESRRPGRRYLSLTAQLLGAAVVAALLLFGIIALRHTTRVTAPFPEVEHPLKPTALWGAARAPYPTGAWWLNLVLEKGDQNVAVLPYSVKATNEKGLEISYSAHRHLSTSTVEADLWAPDFRMASVENLTEHYVESYDALSVSLAFRISAGGSLRKMPSHYRTHLVRGCPYITVEYTGATPVVEPPNLVTVINGLQYRGPAAYEAPQLTNNVFDITVISGQRWLLFADPPVTLAWKAESGLRASAPYTGVLRLALAPTDEIRKVLVDHAHSYPTGGEVNLDYEQQYMITYEFHKKGTGPLLMMALPHHRPLLQGAKTVSAASGVYRTMKGPMTAVVGDRWFLKQDVSDIRWSAPRPIHPSKVSAIKDALTGDLDAIRSGHTERWNVSDPNDPYWHGKKMAMYCRLALIADEIGMRDESMELVRLAEEELTPWLEGSNANPFVYDATWGGVVIKRGLTDPYVNFGNSRYNDHHFQYGYFAYTGAVIAKLDRGFLRRGKNHPKLNAIVADIMNYDASDQFFPLARHKDFYDGHSWASGLFVQNNGKSQESSSEAIHAYYAASLYGEATGDRRLQKFAQLLMAMEIHSTKFYWHMKNDSIVYDPDFAQNKMVGVVGALDAAIQTWFGGRQEFVHGINFMPFTPITEAFLDREYVAEEYPVLSTALTRGGDPPTPEWRGFIYLDHAIIDPAAAWDEVKSLPGFDSGNSMTNSLYWVATRPMTTTNNNDQSHSSNSNSGAESSEERTSRDSRREGGKGGSTEE